MAEGPRTTKGNRAENKAGKNGKGKKKSRRKLAVWLFFTAAIAIVCGIIGYMLIILNGERILADNQDKLVLPEASIIYDAQGKEVRKLGANRENVEFAEIPEIMTDAVIATEDRRFEKHSGIDLYSIGRAVVKDIVARSAVEGGSTITQQLAKNLFLTQDKTFFRKATEASIAVAIEHKMTKDEIITMYLNRIYFGKGAYGVKAAAEYYFNTDLKDLKLWQAATLAGIPKAPSTYNPINNPDKSKERRGVVLQLMYDQGYITKEEMDQAKAVDYVPVEHPKDPQTYQAFVDYMIDEAEKVSGLTEEQLRIGGYKIYTTLNTQAQTAMEKEFADDNNFEKSVDEQQEQGAMIIVDHRNGEIQGMVGGRDYVNKGFNRVLAQRQPGSSFKPVAVYGPAIETGDWFPWSTLQDVKTCYGSYCPSDSNKVKYVGPLSMSRSIKESRNASAVWLLNQIGVKTGLAFAEKLGFELDSKKDRNLSIGLGGLTYGVTPMQMATAYSAFANDGKSVDPHALTKITDGEDNVVYAYDAPAAKQVMKESTAYYMTQALQGVLEKGGTGVNARIDRPVAGKTGTTQNGIPGLSNGYNRDAWFAGYTAEWTAVVWMGYDRTDKDHMIKKSSEQSAAMFGKVMKAAMKGVPKESFKKPSSMEETKPPAGISDLSATYDETSASVKLTWSAPADASAGTTYRVYRKEEGQAEFTKLLDSLSVVGVDDLSVAPGMSYDYYVTAYDGAKSVEGTPSNTVTVAVPEAEIDQPGNGTDNGNGNNGGNQGGGNNPGNGNGGGEVTPPDNGNGTDNGGGTPPDQGNNGGNGTPGNGGGQTPGDNAGGGNGGTGGGTGGNGGGTGGPGGGTGGGTGTTPPGDGTNPGTGNGTGGNGQGTGTGAGNAGAGTGGVSTGTGTGAGAGDGSTSATGTDAGKSGTDTTKSGTESTGRSVPVLQAP